MSIRSIQRSEAKQRKADGTFTDAPFLSPALALEVNAPPDFLGAAISMRMDIGTLWRQVAMYRSCFFWRATEKDDSRLKKQSRWTAP
jgi:hypothetical protein